MRLGYTCGVWRERAFPAVPKLCRSAALGRFLNLQLAIDFVDGELECVL